MLFAFELPFQTTAPDLWAGLLAAVLVVLGFHWLARRRDARLSRQIQDLVGTLRETGKVSWGHMESTGALVKQTEQGLRRALEEVGARASSLERSQQQAGAAHADLESRLGEAAARVPALGSTLAELRQRVEAGERARLDELEALTARVLAAEQRFQEAEQALGTVEGRTSQLEGRSRDVDASLQLLLAAASEKTTHLQAEIAQLAERLERTAEAAVSAASGRLAPPVPTLQPLAAEPAHGAPVHAGTPVRDDSGGGLLALALLLVMAAVGLALGAFTR